MKKKKILFFGELPPRTIHGVSYSNKLNVDMLEPKMDLTKIEEYTNFDEHGRPSLNKIVSLFKYAKDILVYSLKNKFDFFYLTLSISKFGVLKTFFLISIYSIFNKGKIILHVHRGDFIKFYYESLYNRITITRILNLVDRLVVLSLGQSIEVKEVFNVNVFVLENSITNEYDFPNKSNTKHNNFLFVSNYLLEKGIFDLLEVFSNEKFGNENTTLECFGTFSNKSVERKIRNYESTSIKINEKIMGKNKFLKILKSDCIILPSWNEGQPLIIIEAMSVGTIVIASNVGAIKELVGNEYPFLFKARDKRALINTIRNFNEMDIEKRNDLSVYLKSKYIKQYSHTVHKMKLHKVFSA